MNYRMQVDDDIIIKNDYVEYKGMRDVAYNIKVDGELINEDEPLIFDTVADANKYINKEKLANTEVVGIKDIRTFRVTYNPDIRRAIYRKIKHFTNNRHVELVNGKPEAPLETESEENATPAKPKKRSRKRKK